MPVAGSRRPQLKGELLGSCHGGLAHEPPADVRCCLAVDLGPVLQQGQRAFLAGSDDLKGSVSTADHFEQSCDCIAVSHERDFTRFAEHELGDVEPLAKSRGILGHELVHG